MAKITKDTVKAYLRQNETLAKDMQDRMDNPDNWEDLKRDLSVLVAKFGNSRSPEDKMALDSLISANYVTNSLFGKDALEEMLKGLGINQELVQEENVEIQSSKNSEEYRREIYAKLGLEYVGDILARRQAEFEEQQDKKYGIKREKQESKVDENKSNKITKEEQEGNDDLSTFEDIPPEFFEEHKVEIESAGKKLKELEDDLMVADELISIKNKANLEKIPEEIKEMYTNLSTGKMDEEALEKFEDALEKLFQENPEMSPEIGDEAIGDNLKKYVILQNIAQEVEIKHKLIIIKEVKIQLEQIIDILKEYEEKENLNQEEILKRDAIREIAKRKVELLESAGLSKVITEGEKGNEDIFEKAKGILLPELESARDEEKDKLEALQKMDEKKENENKEEQESKELGE